MSLGSRLVIFQRRAMAHHSSSLLGRRSSLWKATLRENAHQFGLVRSTVCVTKLAALYTMHAIPSIVHGVCQVLKVVPAHAKVAPEWCLTHCRHCHTPPPSIHTHRCSEARLTDCNMSAGSKRKLSRSSSSSSSSSADAGADVEQPRAKRHETQASPATVEQSGAVAITASRSQPAAAGAVDASTMQMQGLLGGPGSSEYAAAADSSAAAATEQVRPSSLQQHAYGRVCLLLSALLP